jgi:hypothetical protein
MLKVIIIENNFEADIKQEYECQHLGEFLKAHYGDKLPNNTRIYHNNVSDEADVTPYDENSVNHLLSLDGTFYVVHYAGDPITAIISLVAVVVGFAATYFLLPTPEIPSAANRNVNSESSNNELSERENKPRINAAIEDIYGKVRSTPTLIQQPYKVFIGNKEIEYTYMCIGVGYYDILDAKDDTTDIASIDGAYAAFYNPNLSPNNGTPFKVIGKLPQEIALSIRGKNDIKFVYPNSIQIKSTSNVDFTDYFSDGDFIRITESNTRYKNGSGVEIGMDFNGVYEIDTVTALEITLASPENIKVSWDDLQDYPTQVNTNTAYYRDTKPLLEQYSANVVESIKNVKRLNSVNGQGLIAKNAGSYKGNVRMVYPNKVEAKPNMGINFLEKCVIGDILEIVNSDPPGANSINYDGVYTIEAVTTDYILLYDAPNISTGWDILNTYPNNGTGNYYPDYAPGLLLHKEYYIGEFIIDDMEEIWCNFVAPNGLYKDNGSAQYAVDAEITVEVTPVDANNDPMDTTETFTTTLYGSAVSRSSRGVTLKCNPTFNGRCSIKAYRSSDTDTAFSGTVVDEVKWRDIYAVLPVSATNFGNITTVQTVTQATEGALVIKNRKFNCLVQRKIKKRTSGSSFTSTLYATSRIDEIISHLCLDDYNGRLNTTEIDFDNIYDTVEGIEDYFGTDKAVEFNYTFDKSNMSFEEKIAAIANVIFCTAYRQSGKIKINFEKKAESLDAAKMLFNHRNKVPNTEKRDFVFGKTNEHDGIEFDYVNPDDDSIVTLYLPSDQSAINPKKIESIGIRNKIQAYWQAWRAYQKIIYQNTIVEFEALQESDLLVRNDRILVADNVRSNTQDGEVVAVSGLTLTLSQPYTFEIGKSYIIFLQHYDATIESIAITAGSSEYEAVLSDAPRLTLSTDSAYYAKTVYWIVADDDIRIKSFLISEKEAQSNFTNILKCVNYNDDFYVKDKDYINNIIDINGNEL